MKARFYLAMAVAALLMSNCSQDEPLVQSKGATNTLTATIEGTSRSAVTDGGAFSWTTGDAISVHNGEGFTTFTLSSGNTFTATETITPSGVAIYPAGTHSYDESGTTTVNLKSEYAYGSTNAPMLAEVTSGTLTFKHLGGLMRFVVKGVPTGAGAFNFKANSVITGEFTVEASGEDKVIRSQSPDAAVAVTSNNEVTINYTADQANSEKMVFYVPLPTGTYSGYTVTVGNKSNETQETIENTINRGTLLLMPTFTYVENETELQKGEDNMVVLNGNETLSLEVGNNEEVTVAVAQGATATLNLTASDEATAETVTISDGSEDGTESSTSAGTLNVNATDVSNLTINTPTLTVKLTSGSYDKVEALTAEQTLIIGDGVTIDELVINGGNVKLEGDLTLAKPLAITTETTIDLNGYAIQPQETFEGSDALILVRRGGNLTITDSSEDESGRIDTGSKESIMGAIKMTDVSDSGEEAATLTVNGGHIKGYYYGIMGNGGRHNTGITISGGTIEAGYCAEDNTGIFHPQSGTLTISGGSITGYKSAVEMRAGTLTINGGTFESTATKEEAKANANGNTITGAAIAVSQHITNKELNVTINNGTFKGVYALYEADQHDDVVDDISLSVTGGTFNGSIYTENCPKAITGGTFSDPSACYFLGDNANVIVNMEENYEGAGFKTQSGQTVTMTIAEDKTYTVTAPLVGSPGTQNLGFQFLKDSNVKINGGTITSSAAKMLINNYADLTLSGVTLAPEIPNTMNGQAYYVLSNNCGEVNIGGGTIITAPTSSDATNCPTVYAFDVCKYLSYPNVTVNVKDATITGDVEYTGEGENQKLIVSESATIEGDLVVKAGVDNPAITVDSTATIEGEGWENYYKKTEEN